MKRRGVKRNVLRYDVGAKFGFVWLELECGHEKQAVQGRCGYDAYDYMFLLRKQRYAFCSRCK